MGRPLSATDGISFTQKPSSTSGSSGKPSRRPPVPLTVDVKGLRRKKDKWYFRIKRNGRPFDRCTGLKDTDENIPAALAMRAAAIEELKAGGMVRRQQQQANVSFPVAAAEFLKAYDLEHRDKPKTGRRVKTSFASLLFYFGSRSIASLSPADVEGYKTWRRENYIKEVTIRHDLHAFSLFCQYARRMAWMTIDPLDEVEIPSDKDAVRINVLSPEAERQYLYAAREVSIDLSDVSTIMLQQGCRPEEVMTLEQANVDLAAGKFRIVVGKSRAAKRTLKMTPEVKRVLARRLETPGRWVFPSPRKRGAPIATLQKPHDKAVEKSGVACTIYDFRHTFATRLATDPKDPCPLPILAAILGHSSLSCLTKYVHPQQAHMDDAMERHGQALAPGAEFLDRGLEDLRSTGGGPGATLGPLSGQNRATLAVIWTNPKRRKPAGWSKGKSIKGKEASR